MFFTDNQLEILNIFFSKPDAELHMSGLGHVLGKKPGVFQKGLNKLEAEGILSSQMKRNQRLFSLNKKYPFLSEIQRIVEKTAGTVTKLSSIFQAFDDIALAFIFGSFARNKMRVDSDIDIIIVCPSALQGKVLKKLDSLEEKVLREINPKFYTPSTFAKKMETKDSFLCEILTNKTILLKGTL